ncbi:MULTISPECIES: magnesium transporter [Marinomonas]|uniref:Magnesium transporter n=1 Tax=Marinomonas arctica TaxID=383750 RepID=A0A7H1J3S0_9GAMM|nr:MULTISPECIES: magnesium transporter [Marinomonas]MCS7486987.1 magnesium transporter [Marinomonas sp. BSi20414]QNT05136.1 magnesium transporter [Marinomonas arctica]GGN15866.1 magnesium transporter [Marinomonas arctica]
MHSQVADLIETLIHDEHSPESINKAISELTPDDVALALESIPLAQRKQAWANIKQANRLDILVEMRGESRQLLLKGLDDTEIETLFTDVDAEDLLEITDSLPDRLVDIALKQMDNKQREYYQQGIVYDDDVVGRWIDHELLIASQSIRVSEALRLLKKSTPNYTDMVYLVNRTGRWVGCVRFDRLFKAQGHEPISSLIDEECTFIHADTALTKAAEQLERSSLSALPVVDDNHILLGRFHAGLAMETWRLENEAQQMSTAGLNEESDLFAPVKRSAATRGIWLGINLLTAFLASAFIGLFEATLQQVVALAVLMPVVASMGGIAGSQTLTLIVRGLALGQITRSNLKSLLSKELKVGGLNGLLWAIVIGVVTLWWFESPMLGAVIGLAIIVNIFMAALSGVLIPVLLDKLRIDPALSGSVILTTVTDIAGFVAFLGLGTLLLL